MVKGLRDWERVEGREEGCVQSRSKFLLLDKELSNVSLRVVSFRIFDTGFETCLTATEQFGGDNRRLVQVNYSN